MRQLIWIVYLVGLFVCIHFWGTTGRVVFYAGVFLVITLFRRQLVVALTRLSSKLGLITETIDRMPAAIHLSRAREPAEAARPILAALAACKFVDAGAWNINELPKIQVALMVQPEDGMLAAVESASPIGAHVNIHTLYPDGKLFSVTNSELPAPRATRPNVTRAQFPRCAPNELIKQAYARRPASGFRSISVEEAPRIYEALYAEDIRFRKATGR
jgi:hypothetical protein